MGFLFSDKLLDKSKKNKNRQIPLATAHKYGCKVCSLNRTHCLNPKIPAHGSENPKIYVLGGFPTEADDQLGKPLADPIYDSLIDVFPHSIRSKTRYNLCTQCKAPSGKAPKLIEIEACRKRIEEDIERTKPPLILGVGKTPIYWMLKDPEILSKESTNTWHGLRIPVKIRSHTCWFIPLHTPQEIKDKRRINKRTGAAVKGEWDDMYERDIKESLKFLQTGESPYVVEENYMEGVEWTEGKMSDKELNKVLKWISDLKNFNILALDIETDHEERTGDIDLDIRPYTGDGLILTIALGNEDTVYAFPLDYPRAWTLKQLAKIKFALLDLLLNYKGEKIGHNVSFDLEWLAFCLSKDLLWNTNWKDTQAQSAALLNRRGTLSLDVQVLLKFGFFLKSLTSFDKSKMKEYPLKDILPYNGMDTLWTARLYLEHKEALEKIPALEKVADHMSRTVTTLLRGQNRGLPVNKEIRNKFDATLKKEIDSLQQQIQEIPEVQLFKETYKEIFNPMSSASHLPKIFKDIYGLDEELRNSKGKISTDETVLKKLDIELAEKILEVRSVIKKHSTYVKPLFKFIQDTGLIHHQFNQYVTTTGRLSSSGAMNVQNFPNMKGRNLRSQIQAKIGYAFVPADYGQIEARIIAVASQDANYLKALWEDYDIHYEWAERIALASPKVVGGLRAAKDKKELLKFRKKIKNQWTFPAFYGASPFSISKNLGVPIEIVLDLFEDFWGQFSGVKEWQNSIEKFYKENGYVESLTGRRRYGPMSFNEMINDPIQGTASDITVDAMNRLEDAGIETLMNIHDDVTSQVPIEELEETVPIIAEIMCSVPFPWINCPMSIEIEAGLDWCNTEAIGTFKSTEFMEVDSNIYSMGHYKQWLHSHQRYAA